MTDPGEWAQIENPDAIVLTTLDGKVVQWNAGAQAVFGYTADEATSVVYLK
ncbi:PAS domain S-box protein [Chitinimonas arctica]|uniref:PAS domain S-box protein n=1 Tax=Chitinimonas arctica TaxID=2594795 RepID=A0A516SLB9_9NEIS|nr:PAS domain S-box protein [Chitinimonas arctica]QDQ28957.1 PAS domain S-box protein [Chitinimonas arctica]